MIAFAYLAYCSYKYWYCTSDDKGNKQFGCEPGDFFMSRAFIRALTTAKILLIGFSRSVRVFRLAPFDVQKIMGKERVSKKED